MIIKRASDLKYSDVTPKSVYLNRRKFLATAAVGGGALLAGRAVWDLLSPSTRAAAATQLSVALKSPFSTSEPETPYDDVTHYNNFYEFGTRQSGSRQERAELLTSPWSVSVEGEVERPRKFTMEEILKLAPLEERIYRHRCVEAWSIVVPWIGYSLSRVWPIWCEPTPTAKFVAFESYFSPNQMPLAQKAGIQLPYVEGLRLTKQ